MALARRGLLGAVAGALTRWSSPRWTSRCVAKAGARSAKRSSSMRMRFLVAPRIPGLTDSARALHLPGAVGAPGELHGRGCTSHHGGSMRKLMLVLGMAAVVGCGGISKKTVRRQGGGGGEVQGGGGGARVQERDARGAEGDLAEEARRYECSEVGTGNGDSQADGAERVRQATGRSSSASSCSSRRTRRSSPPRASTPSTRWRTPSRSMKDKAVIVAGFTDDAERAGRAPRSSGGSSRRHAHSRSRSTSSGAVSIRRSSASLASAKPGLSPRTTPCANRALNRRAEIALTPSNIEMGTAKWSRRRSSRRSSFARSSAEPGEPWTSASPHATSTFHDGNGRVPASPSPGCAGAGRCSSPLLTSGRRQ